MSRLLTTGEIAAARQLFKGSVNYSLVKIHNKKYVFLQLDNSGMTPNGEIYVHGIYSQDYAKEASALRGFFIHELVHVWQHQNNVLNVKIAAILEIIANGFSYNECYRYSLDPEKDLTDYKIEQQASIIEDFYRISVEKILPRRARLKNNETGLNLLDLYQAVLRKFLLDPDYAKRN